MSIPSNRICFWFYLFLRKTIYYSFFPQVFILKPTLYLVVFVSYKCDLFSIYQHVFFLKPTLYLTVFVSYKCGLFFVYLHVFSLKPTLHLVVFVSIKYDLFFYLSIYPSRRFCIWLHLFPRNTIYSSVYLHVFSLKPTSYLLTRNTGF